MTPEGDLAVYEHEAGGITQPCRKAGLLNIFTFVLTFRQFSADFLCLWLTDSPVSSPAGGVLEFALTVS